MVLHLVVQWLGVRIGLTENLEVRNFKQLTWEDNAGAYQALEAANNFISSYPFYKSVVHVDCERRSFVTIPVRISKEHFQFESSIFTLRFAERSWHVKVINYRKLTKICAGWAAFTKANYLKEGDVCIFELIENHVLNVFTFECVH
ncbi:conserved hypothetical protein [Ricinus communis]|uniref:TF-B3 domain-containing protein n=1 Tax=Ricinus communis TaxID=3988 RepID=B9S8P7_RICCO|nr:conserved hypothetical protein [Ricinus communis]